MGQSPDEQALGTWPSGYWAFRGRDGDTWKLPPDIFPDCGNEAWAQTRPENWDLKSWVCDHGEVERQRSRPERQISWANASPHSGVTLPRLGRGGEEMTTPQPQPIFLVNENGKKMHSRQKDKMCDPCTLPATSSREPRAAVESWGLSRSPRPPCHRARTKTCYPIRHQPCAGVRSTCTAI